MVQKLFSKLNYHRLWTTKAIKSSKQKAKKSILRDRSAGQKLETSRQLRQKIETPRQRQPLKKRDCETHENRLKFCETRIFLKDHSPPLLFGVEVVLFLVLFLAVLFLVILIFEKVNRFHIVLIVRAMVGVRCL